MADACLFLIKHYDENEIINIGTGKDVSIAELADTIKEIVGYNGDIRFDNTKPDGAPRKLLDVSKLNKLGWKPKHDLYSGIKNTYDWFKQEAII